VTIDHVEGATADTRIGYSNIGRTRQRSHDSYLGEVARITSDSTLHRSRACRLIARPKTDFRDSRNPPFSRHAECVHREVSRLDCDCSSYDFRVPLGMVVRDVYADDERLQMYETLDVLLRAGWHRAGVYCFWDPETRQPFYLGLAKDLPARFAQHNCLKGRRPGKGNKGEQINGWFSEHERLGFSVVLQEGMAR
jgi:hypothetical protein